MAVLQKSGIEKLEHVLLPSQHHWFDELVYLVLCSLLFKLNFLEVLTRPSV